MKTSIAFLASSTGRDRDEINFNFQEMWFLIFGLSTRCFGRSKPR